MDLTAFIEEIESQNLNLEGIIVTRRGERLAGHRRIPEARRNVYSVSKSFSAIAIGMAVDEGKLNISDKVTDFFPRPAKDPRWDSLTLEHLLTMNLGHAEFTRPSGLTEALSYELVRDPGSGFLYDNTCTFLASAMLTKATGQKLRDYLMDRLFIPLGIPEPVWAESEDGYSMGATGLEISTAEMARFGQFLLQKGNWNGKQLVSPLWIDAATRTQVTTRPDRDDNDYDLGYGYQFWTCRHGAYRADGAFGQFIVVIPSLEAVIAVNSNEEKNTKAILWALWDKVLPLLRD